jgi:hypothetical protein
LGGDETNPTHVRFVTVELPDFVFTPAGNLETPEIGVVAWSPLYFEAFNADGTPVWTDTFPDTYWDPENPPAIVPTFDATATFKLN